MPSELSVQGGADSAVAIEVSREEVGAAHSRKSMCGSRRKPLPRTGARMHVCACLYSVRRLLAIPERPSHCASLGISEHWRHRHCRRFRHCWPAWLLLYADACSRTFT
eukprot:661463-Pleurochrysis_carterae.AAC.1